MIAFMFAWGGFLAGWILSGLFHQKSYDEAIRLVHEFDEENRHLTENILTMHRERRLESQREALQ